MTLGAFLAKRIIYTVILVFFVIVLNFLIFEAMPGQIGAVYSIAGQRSANNNDQYNRIVKIYHLNESFQSRFVAYIENLLTFNFGDSYSDHQPVLQGMIGSGLLIKLQYLFLPAVTLTSITYGGFLLLTRATMLETLSDDYITTARAKGLSERVIMFKHAFKNASLPIVTATALSFGGILGGAIITETLFNWNGLGAWLYEAVLYKDFP